MLTHLIDKILPGRAKHNLPLLAIGAAAVVLAVSSLLLTRAVKELETTARAQQEEFSQVNELAAKLKAAAGARATSPRAGDSGQKIDSLPSWLEREIKIAGLGGSLKQISPKTGQGSDPDIFRERAVIRLENLTMATLLGFLDRLDQTTAIKLIEADIRRASDTAEGVVFSGQIGLF